MKSSPVDSAAVEFGCKKGSLPPVTMPLIVSNKSQLSTPLVLLSSTHCGSNPQFINTLDEFVKLPHLIIFSSPSSPKPPASEANR